MKVIGILLLTLLISCGKKSAGDKYTPPTGPNYSPIFTTSDLTLEDIAEEFYIEYYHQKGEHFNGTLPPINFYDLKTLNFVNTQARVPHAVKFEMDFHYDAANNQTTMAGVCLSYPNGQKEILIDTAVWETIGQGFSCGNNECYERRRALVFHELGHCVLERQHKDSKYQNFNLSIMNSVLLRQNDVLRWEQEYFEELFSLDHSHLQSEIATWVQNNP